MLNRLFNALEKTRSSISNAFKGLSGNNISNEDIEQIEEKLLLADIGFNTVENIIKIIKKFRNDDFLNEIKKYLITELPQKHNLVNGASSPMVIMVVGVNGTGKTTSAAKLAKLYKDLGNDVTLVAADTYRAAAVEQLRIWSNRANTRLVCNEKATEPSAVLFDGLTSALSNNSDIVIVDTAGRLHTYDNLMSELEKMHRISTKRFPQFIVKNIITIDSLLGQNSIVQAEQFNNHVPLDGAILTKLDGTAKGGIVFSLYKKLKIPVQYIGIGEELSDLEMFDPMKYVDGLFGIKNVK
jgi:fused signal recognition particle receptor